MTPPRRRVAAAVIAMAVSLPVAAGVGCGARLTDEQRRAGIGAVTRTSTTEAP